MPSRQLTGVWSRAVVRAYRNRLSESMPGHSASGTRRYIRVNGTRTSLLTDTPRLPTPGETWGTRVVSWVASSRAHRVICLVLGIWLLNGFDLAFTLLSHRHGLLQEQNPIARFMLGDGTSSIVLFKIGLVLIGSYPLLRFRRLRLAELAAFLVLAAYVFLAVRWSTCFDLYTAALPSDLDLAGLTDPQVIVPH